MLKSDILNYVRLTPANTNLAILEQMIEAYKSVPTVSNENDFDELISDATKTSIEISGPIDMSKETQINHKVNIDGNNQPISTSAEGKVFTFLNGAQCDNLIIESSADNSKWNSSYGIHFYTANNSLNNATIKGFNAAILINGGELKLNGTINISGNTFGGIEVSKGTVSGLQSSLLDINNAKIINNSEEYGKPTIWIDGITDDIGKVIGANNMTQIIFTKEDGTQQIHYYLKPENAIEPEIRG